MRNLTFLLLAVIAVMPLTARAAVEYTVTDLTEVWQNSELFSGQNGYWHANALNDQGQVVGSFGGIGPDDPRYAILWDENSGLQEIGNLGVADSVAIGINNNGQIVGRSADYSFLWSDSTGMSSLGSLSATPDLGVAWDRANDINDQGTAVGMSDSDYMMSGGAFVWTEAEGMQPIGDFSGYRSIATAINNSGQVVGYGDTAPGFGDEYRRAFLWDANSGAQLLPLIGDGTAQEISEALDINNLGDVVGEIGFLFEGGLPGIIISPRRAILWQDDTPHDLGDLGGINSSASAINENGVIVGSSDISVTVGAPRSHAFIWDEEQGMRDLNELIEQTPGPIPEITLIDAIDINNNGWILAEAQYIGHFVLLKPIPEPSTATLLLIAAFCLPFYVGWKTFRGGKVMRYFSIVLLATTVFLPSAAQAAVEYTVTDLTEVWQNSGAFLGQPNYNTHWRASELNDQGQVVGTVENMDVYNGPNYALLWDENNGLQEIGNLGVADSYAGGINNNGQVVGSSKTPIETDGNTYPFLWSNSTGMNSLGLLSPYSVPGLSGFAADINDQGVVVGVSQSDEISFGDAFIWTEAAGMQQVGDFGGERSNAFAINNSGQVVGYGATVPGLTDELRRAYVWDADSGTQLLPLVGDGTLYEDTEAYDINDLGDVVGSSNFFYEGIGLAILWRNGEANDLGNLGGTHASARAINESGVIVGYSATSDSAGHAFIWDEGRGIRDLNELIAPSDLTLYYSRDINNEGWILADALYGDGGGPSHIVLLKPIPEPSTTVLLLTAALCLPFFFRLRLLRVFY